MYGAMGREKKIIIFFFYFNFFPYVITWMGPYMNYSMKRLKQCKIKNNAKLKHG